MRQSAVRYNVCIASFLGSIGSRFIVAGCRQLIKLFLTGLSRLRVDRCGDTLVVRE